MNISEFLEKLHSALCDRGVSPEDADDYTSRLKKYLTPEETENATDEEILESCEICICLLRKKGVIIASTDDGTEPEIDTQATMEYSISEIAGNDSDDEEASKTSPEEEPFEGEDFDPVPDPELYESEKISARGKLMLVLVTFLTSPLWILAGALFILPFALMVALEAALTVSFVALLAGGAAGGTAVSLTGIVYGIISLFSEISVGIYEIGFGVILAGVTMVFSILSYNGAVRLMPWVFKKTRVLFKLAKSKVKPLISMYKERCVKL